jgi:hypothetical protein
VLPPNLVRAAAAVPHDRFAQLHDAYAHAFEVGEELADAREELEAVRESTAGPYLPTAPARRVASGLAQTARGRPDRAMRRCLIVLGLAALGAAGCGATSPAGVTSPKPVAAKTQPRPNPTAPLAVSLAHASAGRGRVIIKSLQDPQAYALDGSLYVAQNVTPRVDAGTEVISELMRVDPRSGHVLAVRQLGSAFDQALLAHHILWVTTTTTRHQTTSLWQLNPRSLTVRHRTILPGSGRAAGPLGTLAVAGGQLWVGTGSVQRVSLTTGLVYHVVHLGYPGAVAVASDRTGRILLASVGVIHPTYVVRLNPNSGMPHQRSASFWSSSQPSIGGIIDGGAWINDSSGMTSSYSRLSLATLKPTPVPGKQIGGNRSFAQLIDGILYITKPGRGELLTYCGDPATGQLRARLPLPGDTTPLAAEAASIFYQPPGSTELVRTPTDPRCTS